MNEGAGRASQMEGRSDTSSKSRRGECLFRVSVVIRRAERGVSDGEYVATYASVCLLVWQETRNWGWERVVVVETEPVVELQTVNA